MQVRVDFPAGMSFFEGTNSCRLEQFAKEACAVLLESCGNPDEKLLLGVVARFCPEFSLALTQEERNVLGLGAGEDAQVFCRMVIPQEDPSLAGFDLERLVIVNVRAGLGLEKNVPGQPAVPMLKKNRKHAPAR
ncbi:MAG: flagellar assembly protein FliW [Mailhella sp.]|nr:flagellar assembly protein FliW [Mailhella sp.]